MRIRLLTILAAFLLSARIPQSMLCFAAPDNPGFIREQKSLALQALDRLRSLGLSPEGLIIMLRGGDPSEDAQEFADEVYDTITGQIAPDMSSGESGQQTDAADEEGAGGETIADDLLKKAEDIKNDAQDLATQAGSEAAKKVNEIVEEEKNSFVDYLRERMRRRLHDFVDSVF